MRRRCSGLALTSSPICPCRTSAEECARIVLRAMERRERFAFTTLRAKVGRWIKLVAPALVDRLAADAIAKRR